VTTTPATDKQGSWEQNAQFCSVAVGALFATARLPAQQVLDQFTSPAAGECCRRAGTSACVLHVNMQLVAVQQQLDHPAAPSQHHGLAVRRLNTLLQAK
jgi:hypothetical protein